MGNENAERLQTSLLRGVELKAVKWLVSRMPAWVTSDMLTYFGVVAAVLYAVFCWLANYNVHFFWASSFCLVLNWFGDSLDGTMAAIRKTQRPKYGFFIDHSFDALTTCLFCMGLGLSPLMQLSISLYIMGGYLCMSIYTYLTTIVMGKFPLTYAKLGPTEMRLIVILVCTFYIYFPLNNFPINVFGVAWTVYDCIGAVVAAALYITYIVSVAKNLKALALIDPPKKFQKK